jgi:acetolactate synthase regulatory subunit
MEKRMIEAASDLLAACELGVGAEDGPAFLRRVAHDVEQRGNVITARYLRAKADAEEAAIAKAKEAE